MSYGQFLLVGHSPLRQDPKNCCWCDNNYAETPLAFGSTVRTESNYMGSPADERRAVTGNAETVLIVSEPCGQGIQKDSSTAWNSAIHVDDDGSSKTPPPLNPTE